jgi:hypothetical protein
METEDVKLALDKANNQRVPNHKVATDVEELAIEHISPLPRGWKLLLEIHLPTTINTNPLHAVAAAYLLFAVGTRLLLANNTPTTPEKITTTFTA